MLSSAAFAKLRPPPLPPLKTLIMKALSIRQLSKTYANGVQALRGLDLDVDEGDFFALLGPNGAGKTTAIGIVTSLVNKTSGAVEVFGHDIDRELNTAKSCIGLVPQEMNFNQFERVLDIVRGVNDEGLEVCATLGMLNADQAQKLEDAGLYAYNHNLDTSAEYYETIITTRTYDDRLRTIDAVRQTNVTVCSGGIIGMGESHDDRVSMLHTLANLEPAPESVPINVLSQVEGTPLHGLPDVPIDDVVRMVATARIVMPTSVVRLSAGRHLMSFSDQALCFLAGANSIFSSERNIMLTDAVPCADHQSDKAMLTAMGLRPRA